MIEQSIRRKVIILVAIVAGIFIVFKLISNELSKVTLTVASKNKTTVTVAKSVKDEHDLAPGKDIERIEQGQTEKVRLKKGVYFLKFSESAETDDFEQELNLTSEQTIEAPELNYTEQKLKTLMESENNSLNELLSANKFPDNYTAQNHRLFKRGEWFGVDLISKSSAQDNVKLVAKKENGTWKIVAGPKIILSIRDFPDVPEEVIRMTNNP